MKVVILCGGMGTRLKEETEYRPKPMVEIIKPISLALINTGIMMIVIFSIKEYLFVQIGFMQFFILIIIGIIIYLIIAYFYDKFCDYGIYKLIKSRIKGLIVKNKIS
jgi:NDP-sugar pyrophosphorylase family protein